VNTNQNLMSIVMFLSPQEDVLIDVAPELIDEGHPRLYKAVGAGAYETEFMSKDLQGKEVVHDLLIEQAKQVNG
jgi:hypothetical protein